MKILRYLLMALMLLPLTGCNKENPWYVDLDDYKHKDKAEDYWVQIGGEGKNPEGLLEDSNEFTVLKLDQQFANVKFQSEYSGFGLRFTPVETINHPYYEDLQITAIKRHPTDSSKKYIFHATYQVSNANVNTIVTIGAPSDPSRIKDNRGNVLLWNWEVEVKAASQRREFNIQVLGIHPGAI